MARPDKWGCTSAGQSQVSEKHLGAQGGQGEHPIQQATAGPALRPAGSVLSSAGSVSLSPLFCRAARGKKPLVEKTPNQVRPLTRILGPHVPKLRSKGTN